VAVGASFIVTAGSSQALGYLGPFFDASGKHRLTEQVTYRVLALGLAFALAVGALLLGIATVLETFPRHLLGIAAAYYALLSTFWLGTAALYMIRAYAAIVLATITGIAV